MHLFRLRKRDVSLRIDLVKKSKEKEKHTTAIISTFLKNVWPFFLLYKPLKDQILEKHKLDLVCCYQTFEKL